MAAERITRTAMMDDSPVLELTDAEYEALNSQPIFLLEILEPDETLSLAEIAIHNILKADWLTMS